MQLFLPSWLKCTIVLWLFLDIVEGRTYYHVKCVDREWKKNPKCKLEPGIAEDGAAYGSFQDNVMENGWGKLSIYAGSEPADWFQAGFLESVLTAQQIYDHYTSWYSATFTPGKELSEATKKFIMQQYDYSMKLMSDEEPYYSRLQKVMAQMHGIYHGLKYSKINMTLLDVLLLQACGDLYDIIPATNISLFELDPSSKNKEEFANEFHRATSCSALILQVGEDLFAGHTTWSTYENMLRIFKNYYLDDGFYSISFSSKPGLLYSKDDFYVLYRSKLIIMETTNGIMNKDMYKKIVPESLLTWQRIPIANGICPNGQAWTEYFGKHNSGTYANQWMVVDLKQFSKVSAKPGFLWVSEVAPDLVISKDVTDVFIKQGNYWPSMNVPYFPEMYAASGFKEAYQTHGDDYSYENCPRHRIFDREISNVHNLDDFSKLLRFNKFQTDEFSKGDPSKSISARSDLDLQHGKAFGGIDTKVTSAKRVLAKKACCLVQNGPTHDDQQPFQWSTSAYKNHVHRGQPDKFDFPFIDAGYDMDSDDPGDDPIATDA